MRSTAPVRADLRPPALAPAARPSSPLPEAQRATLGRLRERVAAIEGEALHRLEEDAGPSVGGRMIPVRSLGVPAADRALAGGFPAAGLTEIHVDETRGAGTGTGFVLALAALFGARASRPVLWAGDAMTFREAGMPYLPGLAGFGLAPAALVVVRTRRLEEAVWAGEEAARSAALALAILEVRGNPRLLSLEGSRRLHFRAREAGLPLILLRQNGAAEPTAAPFRLRIRAGPAACVPDLADRARLIGHPVFDVTAEKTRDGRPQRFFLEWNLDERRFGSAAMPDAEPFPGALAAEALDRPDPARAPGSVVALRRPVQPRPAEWEPAAKQAG